MKHKNSRFEKLESSTRQEFLFQKSSSSPHFQNIYGLWYTAVNMGLLQFLRGCHHIQNEILKYLSLNSWCVFCVLLWIKIGYMSFFFFFSIMCSNVFWKWGSGLWFNWKLRNMIKYSNAVGTRKRAVTQRTVYSILLFDSNGTIIYKIIIIPLSVRLESSGWNYKCNRKVFSEVTSSEVWDNCFFFFLQTKIFLKWSENLKLVTLWRLAKIEQV